MIQTSVHNNASFSALRQDTLRNVTSLLAIRSCISRHRTRALIHQPGIEISNIHIEDANTMARSCQGMPGNLTGYTTPEISVIVNITGDLLRMSNITNVVVFQDRGKHNQKFPSNAKLQICIFPL